MYMNVQRACFAALILTMATSVQAQIVVSHSGMNDPSMEGFTANGTLTNGSGIDDDGTSAWRISSGVAGQELLYDRTLTAQEIADAKTNGYALRTNIRIPTANKGIGSDTIGLWAQLDDDWWLLRFATDASANPTAYIHSGDSYAVTGSGYHLYELIYDPANQNADLFIDGIERLSDQSPGENPGSVFRFGDGDGSNTGAEIMYNRVEFEILGGAIPDVFTWNQSGSGDWLSSSNWSPSGAPDASSETAIFGDAIASPQTVFLNSGTTVNRVEFNNANTYVVAGFGSVTLAAKTTATPVNPSVAIAQGAHQLQAAVNLNDPTTVDIAAGSSLEFVNRLNLNGNTLTKTGDGTLVISNSLNTGNGMFNCEQGSCVGTGTIAGDVVIGSGTLSPGNNNLIASQGVPEPSSLTFILLGTLGALGAFTRPQRHQT